MLRILQNAVGDGRVTVPSTDRNSAHAETSKTIFGAPLSEAPDSVRAFVLQGNVKYVTVSVSPAPDDVPWTLPTLR